MKQLIIVFALTGALITVAGSGFAQQQPAPDAPELATCSQTGDFCKRGCESASGKGANRNCTYSCETNLAECKATGLWKDLRTGQMIPKRKE
jgi:hypothetical protein